MNWSISPWFNVLYDGHLLTQINVIAKYRDKCGTESITRFKQRVIIDEANGLPRIANHVVYTCAHDSLQPLFFLHCIVPKDTNVLHINFKERVID